MNMSHVSRCLRLANFLQSQVGRSVGELARELDVSERTIYRDFRLLQEAGIPVRYDAGKGGHVIEPHFSLKTPPLTGDELVTLLLAAHTSSFLAGQELKRVVHQSIAKILAQAPAHVREETASLLRSCVVESPILWGENEKGVCSEIITAIRRRRQVRISYRRMNESDQLIQTKIAPYRLVASPEGWRLVGRSSVHRRICCFDLQRIQRAEMTEDTYDLPPKYRREVPIFGLVAE